jgi:hypothetical protein
MRSPGLTYRPLVVVLSDAERHGSPAPPNSFISVFLPAKVPLTRSKKAPQLAATPAALKA